MKYLLFTTQTCPNCPSMKEFMKDVNLKGEFIDASTDDGLKKAVSFGVSSVPTVIFLDEKDKVLSEAHNITDAKNIIDANKN
ncbi:MAG: hypothetical protein KAS12_07115 [Candidatus Aenigmarchaeota archaeon]|nr:hypothetical protein [Candidatus Aenigmarchaeota archaeon]